MDKIFLHFQGKLNIEHPGKLVEYTLSLYTKWRPIPWVIPLIIYCFLFSLTPCTTPSHYIWVYLYLMLNLYLCSLHPTKSLHLAIPLYIAASHTCCCFRHMPACWHSFPVITHGNMFIELYRVTKYNWKEIIRKNRAKLWMNVRSFSLHVWNVVTSSWWWVVNLVHCTWSIRESMVQVQSNLPEGHLSHTMSMYGTGPGHLPCLPMVGMTRLDHNLHVWTSS